MSNNIAENIIIPIKSDEESAESFVGVWKIAPTLKYYNDNFNIGRNPNNGILTTWMIDPIEKVLDSLNLNIKLYVGIFNCIVANVVYYGVCNELTYPPNTFYTNTNLIIRVLRYDSGYNYILTTKTEDYNVCIRYDHHPHWSHYSENVEQKNYMIYLNELLNTPRRLIQLREMISRHLVFEINPKIYLDYMLMCDDNERIHRFIHKTDDVNKIKEMETKLLETETKLRETEQKLNEFEKTKSNIKMKMSEHMENVDNILGQVNNIQQSLKNKNNNATIVINVKSFGHSSRILLQRICLSSINCFKWITILGKFMERFSHFSKT
jgi:hypothetical protein